MAAVTFEAVNKKYGDVFVIEDLNLDVYDQEFLVLVGPSGCGKTTALRMIPGLALFLFDEPLSVDLEDMHVFDAATSQRIE